MKPCGVCGEEVPTEKVAVQIKLAHETSIPLISTRDVCRLCFEQMRDGGIEKVRNSRLVLA